MNIRALVIVLGVVLLSASVVSASEGKPRVAVLDFDNHIANPALEKKQVDDVVNGVSTMLITELSRTGGFRIVERAKLDKIKEELLRRNDPFFDKSTFPPIGKLVGADYMIAGAVTEFDPSISGMNIKLKLPKMISIEGELTYAFVRIELRLLDITTGEVKKTAEATATVKNVGGGIGISYAGLDLTGGGFKKTPLGDAFHLALGKAAAQLLEWLKEGSGTSPGSTAPQSKPKEHEKDTKKDK